MFLIPFVVAFICLLLFFIYMNYSLVYKRTRYIKKMRGERENWRELLSKDFSYLSNLTAEQISVLLDKMAIFYCEKDWREQVSKDQRVLICALACLPLINRNTNFYPSVRSDFEDFSLSDWVKLNKLQFEKEVGKLALKELKGQFVELSLLYLESPRRMKESDPKSFKILNHYYRFSV